MNDDSDRGYRYSIPEVIEERIQISDIFLQDSSSSKAGYRIDLSFPELRLYRTLRSREVSLLPGKVEAVLDLWEKKYFRHLQYQTERHRLSAVDQLNRDAEARLAALRSILAGRKGKRPDIDWELIARRDAFGVTPEDLYGIPAIPSYILTDAEGRPADIKRLTPKNRPDLEKTQSQFGAITKIFRRGKVQQALNNEMEGWNKKRSDIGVANAERRATLRQAQDIYDATRSMFEGARESNRNILEKVRSDYAQVVASNAIDDSTAAAVEEHCDLVMMDMVYPDEICSNWLLTYVPERRALQIRLDLPTISQLDIPKSWRYSSESAEVVEMRLTQQEIAELCDLVSYQMLLRTMLDIFVADEAGVIDSIICNGEVAVQSPGTDEVSSYVVLSMSADKHDVLSLDIVNEQPNALFESLGGVAAGAPHLVMPVEPIVL